MKFICYNNKVMNVDLKKFKYSMAAHRADANGNDWWTIDRRTNKDSEGLKMKKHAEEHSKRSEEEKQENKEFCLKHWGEYTIEFKVIEQ